MNIQLKSMDEARRQLLCERINRNLRDFLPELEERNARTQILERELDDAKAELGEKKRKLDIFRGIANAANLSRLTPGSPAAALAMGTVSAVTGISASLEVDNLEVIVTNLERAIRELENQKSENTRRLNELRRLRDESSSDHQRYNCDLR
ncbi:MAG: hypothetical protein JKY32_06065 [Rhizobiales bacterium]|nr:hypothetical protein [Hyphomicrobiales bacterium]